MPPDIPVCLIVFVANVSQAQSDITGKIETRRVLAERYAALSLPLMPNDIEEASAVVLGFEIDLPPAFDEIGRT